jgi:F0F1-type ATP synthase membrane subunit b/b'
MQESVENDAKEKKNQIKTIVSQARSETHLLVTEYFHKKEQELLKEI